MSTSSHWYNDKGESCHEIVGKNGKLRATKITDAREHGFLPSVTTVLGVLAKPQLETWKMRQVIDATLVTPRKDGDTLDAYYDRVIDAAFKQVDDAADLGTAIHKAIEQHFQGQVYAEAMRPYVEGVQKWVTENHITFDNHELRLVNKSHGYAGTTDAIFYRDDGVQGVLDFKSRKSKPGLSMLSYDTEPMQVAAYDIAHFSTVAGVGRAGVNVLVSTTEPGRVEAVWYDWQQLNQAWDAFEACLTIWRTVKGYDPR